MWMKTFSAPLVQSGAVTDIYCSAWALVEAKILVLRFGPKMNTKVDFNTQQPNKLNFMTNSGQSRKF